MTSRFNVNFNGKEALKNGEEEHAKLCKDNFITTLPIYVYPPKEELSSIYPSMDRVIEKGSKCIYKHSMFFKGKEYVKNIDDEAVGADYRTGMDDAVVADFAFGIYLHARVEGGVAAHVHMVAEAHVREDLAVVADDHIFSHAHKLADIDVLANLGSLGDAGVL